MGFSSFAGEHLAGILANRQNPLPIRKQAARYIGQIGYLDALPSLERLAARLEARKNGAADTIPLDQNNDEGSLLPYLKDALAALQSP
jgi:hypothetical protein